MRWSRLTRAWVAAAGAVLLVAASTGCVAPPAFYEPPDSLPPQPGDVIATEPTSFGLNWWGVTSTAVRYRSITATGEPNSVTGTVLVPTAPWSGPGSRPIVSFAVGTQGLGDGCAASKSMPYGLLYEQGAVQGLLDRGWAVAVTDYENLGSPGDHTYVVKDAEAHAVLDIVRAAQRMSDSGVAADSPVGIWGYSQGGQAAAAVAEIESTYAPELDIRGVAAGGVPSDLRRLAEYLNGPGNLFFSFLAFAAVGLSSAYPELDLESYLNEEGRAMLEQGRNACLVDGLFVGMGKNIDSVTTSDPLEDAQWQARVDEQRLGTTAPEVPVLQYHGVFDEIIPFDQGTRLRDAWCGGGAQVQWSEYWFAEHLLGIFQAQGDVTNWLGDRFAGRPFTPTCNA